MPVHWLAFLGAACTAEKDESVQAIAFPRKNLFLADSPWPISHNGPYSQGSSELPGLQSADVEIEFLQVGLTSVTLIPTPMYEDGSRAIWGSTPTEVYRIRLDDSMQIVDSVSSGSGLRDLVGGAYSLLDIDGRFYTVSGETVHAFAESMPESSNSMIEELEKWSLIDPVENEGLRGLGMTYDGVLIVVSSTGRVVALSRELSWLSEVQLLGEVSNSIAIDEDGGIYVVTSEAMHRLQWTGSTLSTDPANGAWESTYENGSGETEPGRLGLGSGSTPSLMTVGEDKLVVITDAQPLMHLVAFWRDKIPDNWLAPSGSDPRVAGVLPVTFGVPHVETSVSEQSVLVMGDGAVVVNNDYGEMSGIEPVIAGLAPPGIELFRWDSQTNTLSSSWALPDVSCPNGIPSASAATGLMYCVGKRDDTWTIEAIDWVTGTPKFHVPMGTENARYNSSYAATEIGPDGSILTGTLTGIVRVFPNSAD